MGKKTLTDHICDELLARTPDEVTSVHREKSEGGAKQKRVKAVQVDTGRVLFRVLEPGEAQAVYVSTKNIPATVEAVHHMLSRQKVPMTRVGC